jgi:hypothetical protein
LSGWGKEELEYLSSLGEGHFLVQFCENFQVEGRRRVGSGDLHHLVYGFGRDEEQDLSGRGDDGSLFGNIVGLTLESELGKMVDLRERGRGVNWTPRVQFHHSGPGKLP